MSDKDLAIKEDADIEVFDFNPDDLAGGEVLDNGASLMLPRISLLQALSDDVTNDDYPEAKAGMYKVDWNDGGLTPPLFSKELAVFYIDGISGRVMYPFDEQTGQKETKTKKPVCASSDGEVPRVAYHGQTFTDWRVHPKDGRKRTVTIDANTTCAACPMSNWITADGKSLKPPCQESPQMIVFLTDFGKPAVFQSAAPTVRQRLIGAPRKGFPGIGAFFQKSSSGTYPYVINGRPHALVLGAENQVNEKSGSKSWVPTMRFGEIPLTQVEYMALVESKKLYEETKMRHALSASSYNPVLEDDDAFDHQPSTAMREAGITNDGSTLGAGSNRRMTVKDKVQAAVDPDEVDPWNDEDEDEASE